MSNTILETDGIWRVITGGLVPVWGNLVEYEPQDTDVPFYFGAHYNWGQSEVERLEFVRRFNIRQIIEIVEVFREPYTDVDSGFRGRGLLIARFDEMKDAILFKMAVPHPDYSPKFASKR